VKRQTAFALTLKTTLHKTLGSGFVAFLRHPHLIPLIGHEVQLFRAKHPMYLIFLPQILSCLNRKPVFNKLKRLLGRRLGFFSTNQSKNTLKLFSYKTTASWRE